MSKKYPNPVLEHFIYSENTRKSTCKKCFFDMAGRHSENLMRHLKRKHEDVYKVVRAKKFAIRTILEYQQKAPKQGEVFSTDQILSSMFHFTSKPKKIRISKVASQLPSNGSIETAGLIDNEVVAVGDNENNASGSQFDDIFIGKTELPDEVDLSNDTEDTELASVAVSAAIPSTSSTAAINSTASLTSSPAPATSVAALTPSAPVDSPLASDDAVYLQYLANKLSKYSERTKNIVQFQINSILYKADMGCYGEADPKLLDSNFI
ncbi:uncharacterized protein LOC108103312 [Drosophila eugracilis]|uniref:uncharacterized protein LOC108103312 n=1 Tax=Drosophila eugracilis TaxID=29029 RepID=UPI0007E7B10B|nr:uncharacterized protein LOC108103312 [Drosophila eugracilis]XP_017064226.1 uncharacterized protein LOC108103312 [Drosophila eugracilis]XP_017064227.1 uncharacterized protein LOC108103312 [Drosophila eugracilis]XP_017064228.1 uncharacterized protein LOC108103312 [Drosophila eugracilis]XP_017064229.1 uncharacterized protein LOC108103312 [Drosophila eugracilis]